MGQSSYIYTEAPKYEAGAERFPSGASLQWFSNGRKRPLIQGFAASCDANLSFDGRRILFAGKQKAGDPWRIWETALESGAPRLLTKFAEDTIAPFYLPGGQFVYARRTPHGFQLEIAPLESGSALRLSYAPGDHIPSDVLRDGRILFDGPQAASTLREIFTVYPDGTGVESYRCDHGRDRRGGRQLESGDIVFETAGRLARFTSARAVQTALPAAPGRFAGPVAEVAPGDLLVAYRPRGRAYYGLYRWAPGHGAPRLVIAEKGVHAVQPVLVKTREMPRLFPSAIGRRAGANLLCLDAYTSRATIPAGSVAAVRVWALGDSGKPVALGQAPVEKDGSFYLQAPGERAIRFELLNHSGKTVAAEKGWFWARTGEQRVCVGCHAGPERAPDNVAPRVLLRTTEPVRMGGVK